MDACNGRGEVSHPIPQMSASPITFEIAVEPKLKRRAEKVLEELGLDLGSAARVFLKKVVATHSIPFAIAEEPPAYRFTPAEEEEILQAARSQGPKESERSFPRR